MDNQATNLTDRKADPFAEVPGEPWPLAEAWLADAARSEPNDPTAMCLASVDADGLPDARMVLMRGIDRRGITFFTNFESAKGRQLLGQGGAAACFHWKSLRRQLRLRGPIEPVSEAEADAYFASRPRGSRIGAWASQQSRPLAGREALEQAVASRSAGFGSGEVPRPPHWSGFRLRPLAVEFWSDGAFRLHDRLLYRRGTLEAAWDNLRLFP